ncbi:hypothetical protein [Euzebyella saccharophila]|uniref:DUF2938 domain-containing protein n=1 Tax=Euzebyella saccharophila TaxID=679664 RepID=A0ABV8JUH1_9FLAO|nr:hypothetical protein [Euzebyella saccharophila]
MNLLIVLLATGLATIVMTIFSHVLSWYTAYVFNEAHLLNLLFDNAKESKKRRKNINHINGWLVHIAIGLGMAIGLYFAYLTPFLMNNLLKAIAWGILAGALGIIGWCLLFNVYDKPEKTSLKPFFVQLVIAHILFALTCFIVFKFSH